MSELTANSWIMDLRLQVDRLNNIVSEVEDHIVAGKPDAAALVLSVAAGKVATFNDSYASLRARLQEDGARVDRALM
jgi:hypothetical protein